MALPRIIRKGLPIVVLLGFVVSALIYSLGRTSCRCGVIDTVRNDLNTFSNCLEFYRNLGGQYPSEEQGLEALIDRPTTAPLATDWVQMLDDRECLLDPWRTPYLYLHPGRQNPDQPEIVSAGSDRLFGTEDDLSTQSKRDWQSDPD